MVHRVLFWAGFGVLTRVWQLGLQQTHPLWKRGLHFYPIYATVGGAFGYWMDTVDKKQVAILQERKDAVMEKRARRAARESAVAEAA